MGCLFYPINFFKNPVFSELQWSLINIHVSEILRQLWQSHQNTLYISNAKFLKFTTTKYNKQLKMLVFLINSSSKETTIER